MGMTTEGSEDQERERVGRRNGRRSTGEWIVDTEVERIRIWRVEDSYSELAELRK
jgi:hypothetical protein